MSNEVISLLLFAALVASQLPHWLYVLAHKDRTSHLEFTCAGTENGAKHEYDD